MVNGQTGPPEPVYMEPDHPSARKFTICRRLLPTFKKMTHDTFLSQNLKLYDSFINLFLLFIYQFVFLASVSLSLKFLT